MSYAEKLKDRRWQQRRLEMLEAANWTCQGCGCKENEKTLHVHHGYYLGGLEPWDYPAASLWVFCEACHQEAEEKRRAWVAHLGRFNQVALASPRTDGGLQVLGLDADGYGVADTWVFIRGDGRDTLIGLRLNPIGTPPPDSARVPGGDGTMADIIEGVFKGRIVAIEGGST